MHSPLSLHTAGELLMHLVFGIRFRPAVALPLASALLFAWSTCPAIAQPGDNAAIPADHAQQMAAGLELFKGEVRALLVSHCLECHGGKKIEGDLSLADRDRLLQGGATGPAIVPGKSSESLLYKLIAHDAEPAMPYDLPRLPDGAIASIARWIDLGAPFDRPLVEQTTAVQGQAEVTDADRQFWSFIPVQAVSIPAAPPDDNWCRTPIDRFIRDKQIAAGLLPNPLVDRRRLIRRAYLDLVGVPPEPEEIDAFVVDSDPQAYERLVDRLLASPHYGERWGRHWLDLARWAESHGYEQDYDRPAAYHYRDFVIRALNDDMPYDQFVRWQIAGDELAPDNPLAMMATGFLGAGTHATQITANQVEKERYDELDDMLNTVGTAMLGLTIGCARCHDHKYDPIPTRDYYRLLSTFTTTVRSEIELDLEPERTRAAREAFETELAPLVESLERFEALELPARFERWVDANFGAPLPRWLTATLVPWFALADPEWQQLRKAVDEHLAQEPRPALTKVMVTSEGFTPIRFHTQGADFFEVTYMLKRGDLGQKQGVAAQGFLQALVRSDEADAHWLRTRPEGARTSLRRTALADWITDTQQGAGALLARVIVNRLWQHHFGRGLVATPSDFGRQGDRPSHPELLEYLAGELLAANWRLKPLHRVLLTSAVYMQSIDIDPARAAIDPENILLWHRNRQRLEAEVIRDAMLAASGALDRTLYGPGTLDANMRRRSIYFFIKRSQLIPLMTLFDAPEPLVGIAQRSATTIAPQSLALLNNEQLRSYAIALADRAAQADRPLPEALRLAYVRTLGRLPTDGELARVHQFVQRQTAAYQELGQPDAARQALADACQALFCTNEFIYIE
jgi:mono/diheme cytochrome c family protein